VIITVLGIFDIIAGIILAVGGLTVFPGNGLVITLAFIMIIKGIYSWISNLAAAEGGLKIDPMGILDILAGIILVMIFSNMYFFFFAYLGIIEIIKGVYSFVVGLTK
jgi:uncharacterized membrane protein HdeD (DUF308 family)